LSPWHLFPVQPAAAGEMLTPLFARLFILLLGCPSIYHFHGGFPRVPERPLECPSRIISIAKNPLLFAACLFVIILRLMHQTVNSGLYLPFFPPPLTRRHAMILGNPELFPARLMLSQYLPPRAFTSVRRLTQVSPSTQI